MFSKFYAYADDLQNLNSAIEKFKASKNETEDLRFVFLLDKTVLQGEDHIEKIEEIIMAVLREGIDCSEFVVSVEGPGHKYNAGQWKKLNEINDYLTEKNILFGFEDRKKTWSIHEVENANGQISQIAQSIKNSNLSTYEKLLQAYLTITNRDYNAAAEDQHPAQSRSIYGVLNSDKIVCVGFVQLLKAVVEEIGDENIKVYENHVATSEDGSIRRGLHSTMVVHIKDEKYGLNGYYYLDPTNDSGVKKIPTVQLFMMPLGELQNMVNPYIKDPCVLLPPSEDIVEEKDKLVYYNTKREDEMFFTSDAFISTFAFMKDMLELYPELMTECRKAYVDKNCQEIVNRLTKIMQQVERLNNIKDMFSDADFKLNDIEAIGFQSKAENASKTGNFGLLIKEKQRLQARDENLGGKTSPLAIVEKLLAKLQPQQSQLLSQIESLTGELTYVDIRQDIFTYKKIIDEKLIESGKPLALCKIMKALRKVLKNMQPHLSDEEISTLVHKIIMKSGANRDILFEGAGSDEFVDYYNQMKADDATNY